MISRYFRLPDFRRWRRHEAFWQALALLLAFAVVHAAYELGVRPAAAAELARLEALAGDERAAAAAPWGGRVAVVLKDSSRKPASWRCCGRSRSWA